MPKYVVVQVYGSTIYTSLNVIASVKELKLKRIEFI